MWFQRDFSQIVASPQVKIHPIKVLKGPRQVGKTSLLERMPGYELVLFDDLHLRNQARENPAFFLDQYKRPLILDEAALAPEVFLELKRRVDEARRKKHRGERASSSMQVWITGSNQTLLKKHVQESLAGRAAYFDLNTLSVHELGNSYLPDLLLRGGWPELHANLDLSPVMYLNNLIATFVEKDIVSAAGIEKAAAFSKMVSLVAGQVGQIFNASTIAAQVSAEVSTVQSWVRIMEQNGILRTIFPFFSNLNKRLIKTPKIYFEDVGLAVRFQGWSEYKPLAVSPYFGPLLENLVLIEICRFFTNRGLLPEVYFLRTKEKVEIDFLVHLSNRRYLVVEVKNSPQDYSSSQLALIESLQVEIVENWIVCPEGAGCFPGARVVLLPQIFDSLAAFFVKG